MDDPFRLAIVGCGAITELGHAPGAVLSRRAKLSTLVDLDLDRAKAVGAKFGVADCRDTIEGLEETVDGVIAALHHHAHAPVGVKLLDQGLHVLMEKPLGCSVSECKALASAADRNHKVLATGLMRRFSAANRLAKQIIDQELFGKVVSFEVRDARLFSWPIKTPFLLRSDYPGRGVLIGNGSHFFDLVLWWFGEVDDVECIADTRNGGETDATVTLTMISGVKGVMHLSRIRKFDGAVKIRFERGALELPPFGTDVRLSDTAGRPLVKVMPDIDDLRATNSAQMSELMALQIDDFVCAATGGPGPEVGPEMATAVIVLVERCSQAIEVADLPWSLRRALPDNIPDQIFSSLQGSTPAAKVNLQRTNVRGGQ